MVVMKTQWKASFLLSAMTFFSHEVHAYKFVIYTDSEDTSKSAQVAELMKTTHPFNTFDLQVEVVKISPEELACESSHGIDRLVMCKNIDGIQAMAMRRGGDQAMIVKDMGKWGGSSAIGGGVPVITTGTDARVMLHEYMHTLGLCDEYEYAKSEAPLYCNTNPAAPNLVLITPYSSYSSDQDARYKHRFDIPWYGDILPSTPITTGGVSFGTGEVDFKKVSAQNTTDMKAMLEDPIGVYRGKVCNQSNPPKISWHPGSGSTIMDDSNAGLGAAHEKIVERLLLSKGAKKKMQFDNSPEPAKGELYEPAGSVVVAPEPQPQVNNTSRSFFKSFWSWVQEIFESVGRSFTR